MKTSLAFCLAAGALLGCAQPEVYAPPPVPVDPGAVDLGGSFVIPQKEGNLPSHTPALVVTADGKRLLAATSDHVKR